MKNHFQRRSLIAAAAAIFTVASYAQWTNPADDVPAYHPAAPLKVSALQPILSGDKLRGENFRDRALGHTSLRSCFETLHGTECSTCAKEGFYAYQQTKLGKTPAEIRAGIARHDYESIDLEKQ
jgi:hypothetical protein